MQALLVYTAVKVEGVQWVRNAAGFQHSDEYGFGRMDAYRMSRAAGVSDQVNFAWSLVRMPHHLYKHSRTHSHTHTHTHTHTHIYQVWPLLSGVQQVSFTQTPHMRIFETVQMTKTGKDIYS